jgi:hypothetical protein
MIWNMNQREEKIIIFQMYRVFTYAVGPTANPVSAIRWMACANKGNLILS